MTVTLPPRAGHGRIDWSDLDSRAVDTARILAADAVQSVGHGHPGTAMSLAPAAYLLFQHYLRHDPADPHWIGRDRFVLSCGHTSLTLYTQLYLSGYGLTLDDIASYRVAESLTPGHPEYGLTAGVETTTGPLGQGIGNAVGMAMAARYSRGLLDPDAAPGDSPFDHTVWVFASDGDISEGVQAEAASLAGTQRLGNLIVLYDDNHISIDGDTALALHEDVPARYRAYGWHTITVDDAEDVAAIAAAYSDALAVTDRPVLISLHSVIAQPAPHARGTAAAHGAALGAEEVAATKRALGFDPEQSFAVEEAVLAHARKVGTRGSKLHQAWSARYETWRAAHPEQATLLDRLTAGDLPEAWEDALPEFTPESHPKGIATRAASGTVLAAVSQVLPELWGGSADLSGSNNTLIPGSGPFLPAGSAVDGADPYGRNIHFGIREHAMGAVLNGVALHGLTRAYGGTFLIFSDYMRPSVRLAALMGLPTVYVWTHDSIGLGEDGPTHQPVEQLAALRAIPGLAVVRPADATETAVAWRTVLRRQERRQASGASGAGPGGPSGLCLSRQALPVLDREALASAEGTARGGYVLAEASAVVSGEAALPDALILATGSEVSLALSAREQLEEQGVSVRVVSMPCLEWFAEQDADYRESVLPPAVRARVSVEAGVTLPWARLVGDAGISLGVTDFGASASPAWLYEHFGLTVPNVVQAVRAVVDAISG